MMQTPRADGTSSDSSPELLGTVPHPDTSQYRGDSSAISPHPAASHMVKGLLTGQTRELIQGVGASKETAERLIPPQEVNAPTGGLDLVGPSGIEGITTAAANVFKKIGKSESVYGGLRGFFSRTGKWLDSLPQEKFSGEQLIGQLKAAPVKREEIEWLGLDTFLKDNPKVTKTQVKEFIDSHQIQMQEVTLSGKGRSNQSELGGDVGPESVGKAHYNQPEYKTPGGRNYREVLFRYNADPSTITGTERNRRLVQQYVDAITTGNTRPEVTAQFETNTPAAGQRYSASHFGEQGQDLLAHARVQDFKDVDGSKVLLVDELQSDWHREGRKYGYKGQPNPSSLKAGGSTYTPDQPPDAPFKSTWPELVMKGMLRDAVEKGYDKIAWTTGKTQQERWNLTRFFPEMKWSMLDEGAASALKSVDKSSDPNQFVRIATGENPRAEWSGNIRLSELEDHVGQVAADSIRSSISSGTTSGMMRDVKSGGEWAVNLYDKQVPDFMKKYSKQWGGTIERTTLLAPKKATDKANAAHLAAGGRPENQLPLDQEVWSLSITPAMRQSISTSGQPLWSIGAGLTGAALTDSLMKTYKSNKNKNKEKN